MASEFFAQTDQRDGWGNTAMDTHEHWFDDLLSSMATGASRRTVLRKFGVGVAGSLLMLAGVSVASADNQNTQGNRNTQDCNRGGENCNNDGDCCSGNCRDGFCRAGECEECQTDEDCSSGVCDPQYGLCVPFAGLPFCPQDSQGP
jgi:hypothetical protein